MTVLPFFARPLSSLPSRGPTLARLLLVCASLFLGPLLVMADELQEDTNKITSLTPEQAKRLVETFPGVEMEIDFDRMSSCLPLSGVASLDARTAAALAEYRKGPLLLKGLTTLDAETARSLAEFKGQSLFLDGLTTLDADTANAIAEFKCRLLSLDRLTEFDAASAKALTDFKGSCLSLNGLTTLNADAAKSLAESQAWTCRVIFRVSSTFSDTAPGPRSHWRGSPCSAAQTAG